MAQTALIVASDICTVWPPASYVSAIPTTRARRTPAGPSSATVSPTLKPRVFAYASPGATPPAASPLSTAARGRLPDWSYCSCPRRQNLGAARLRRSEKRPPTLTSDGMMAKVVPPNGRGLGLRMAERAIEERLVGIPAAMTAQ